MKNLNIIQKFAIFWAKNFDRTFFYFESLKSLNIFARVILYILYFGILGSILYILNSITSAYFHTHFVDFENLFIAISHIIYFSILLGVAGIVSYESVFQLDIKTILKNEDERKKEIKRQKKEWWRLRNMPFVVRILLFLFVYYILINFLIFISNLAFFQTYPNPTPENIKELQHAFSVILGYFTISFVSVFLIFEYFINKRKHHV